jgi:hypothetical protein
MQECPSHPHCHTGERWYSAPRFRAARFSYSKESIKRLFLLLASLFLTTPAGATDAIPATTYFPVLPFDALAESAPQLVPVAANHGMDGRHPDITQAIIVIHDETRDANTALASLSALAGSANGTTLILAPQFLLDSDIFRFSDHLPEKGRAFARWQMAGWAQGDDALAVPGHKAISSFTVVDLLLMYLADRDSFPNLKSVTLAGYGAGGNFVQRYAAFGIAADVMARQDIDLRYVVAGASSYLYLTAARPLGGRKGFGRPDLAACPAANDYPYGLDKLNPYARRVGGNAAKTDYALRLITYINAPAADLLPATDCAVLIQGTDRAARAANYRLYLQSLYGDVAVRTQTFSVAQNTSNDAVGLFGSVCGMAMLFGDGICSTPVSGDAP